MPLVNTKCTHGVRVPQLFLLWCCLADVREKRKTDESYIQGGVRVVPLLLLSSQEVDRG